MSIFRRPISVSRSILSRIERDRITRQRRERRLLADEITKTRNTFLSRGERREEEEVHPQTLAFKGIIPEGFKPPKERRAVEPFDEEKRKKLEYFRPIWPEVQVGLKREGLTTEEFLELGEQEQLLLIDPSTNPVVTADRISQGGTLPEVEGISVPKVLREGEPVGPLFQGFDEEVERFGKPFTGAIRSLYEESSAGIAAPQRFRGRRGESGLERLERTVGPTGPTGEKVVEKGLYKGLQEAGGEVPFVPELLVPSNVIPIPILDPLVVKAIGWTAKGTVWASKAGARSLRARLVRALGRSTDDATSKALQEGIQQVDQAVTTGDTFAKAEEMRDVGPDPMRAGEADALAERRAIREEQEAALRPDSHIPEGEPIPGGRGIEGLERDVLEPRGAEFDYPEGETIEDVIDIESERLIRDQPFPDDEVAQRLDELPEGESIEFTAGGIKPTTEPQRRVRVVKDHGEYRFYDPEGNELEGFRTTYAEDASTFISELRLEPFGAPAQGGFTSVDYVDVDIPPGMTMLRGASDGPALIEDGIAPGLARWRMVEEAHITGDKAQDWFRRRADTLAEIPLVKNLMGVLAGPASRAGVDPSIRAGVVYRLSEEIDNNELRQRMARFEADFSDIFKIGKDQRITVGPEGERVAFGDVAESYYRGEITYKLTDRQMVWLDDAKDLVDTVARQYEAVSGQKVVGDDYFPRFTTDEKGAVHIGGRPGKKQSPVLERLFEEMESGIEAGIDYTNPLHALELYGRSMQKMTRDKVLQYVALEDDIVTAILPQELIPDEIFKEIDDAKEGLKAAQRLARGERAFVERSRESARESERLLHGRLGQAQAGEALERGRVEERFRLTEGRARPGPRFKAAAAETQRAGKELAQFEEVAKDFPKRTEGPARGVSERTKERLVRAEEMWKIAKRRYGVAMDKARARAMRGKKDEIPGIALGPAFSDVVVNKEKFERLRAVLAPGNPALQPVANLASIPRLLVTGLLDVGQFAIQMLPMWATSPRKAAAATGRGFQAMLKPRQFQRWISKSADAKEAAKYGVDLGGSELTEAVRTTALGKIPPLKVVPRGFDGMLAAARVYEFKALRELATKGRNVSHSDEFYKLARYVNTKLGTPNVRGLGVSATQSQVESAFVFFSQRYTRSVMGMLSHAMGTGVAARDARRSLGTMLFTGMTSFYALARATGMNHQEALERINPRSGGKFMSIPIGGNEFGMGSAYRSFMKFAGDLTVKDNWEFDSWEEAALENPITRFLRGRTSPVTGVLIDTITGEDFLGQQVDLDEFVDNPAYLVDYAMDKFLPLNIRAWTEARGSLAGKIGAAAVETVGGRTVPRSPYALLEEARKDTMEERGISGSYEDLKEKDRILSNEIDESPRVQEALQRIEDERRRFPETGESQYFRGVEEKREASFEEQEADDENLSKYMASGGTLGMAPDRWKDRLRERQTALAAGIESLQEAYGVEFGEDTAEPGTVNVALEQFYNVQVDAYTDDVTGETNWPAFFDAREESLSGLSKEDKRRVDKFTNRYDTPLVRSFELLRPTLSGYYEIPQEDRAGREIWRRRNPEGDASLFLIGNTTGVMTSAARDIAERKGRQIFGRQIQVSRRKMRVRSRRGRTDSLIGGLGIGPVGGSSISPLGGGIGEADSLVGELTDRR